MRNVFLSAILLILPVATFGQDTASRPIRFLRHPSLSPDAKTIAFSWQGDIWTVASEGGTAQRLTIHEAHDQLPSWSPDGKWLAFSSKRDGNYDVYIQPSGGGRPKQLTFHSADDGVGGWSPDGKEILFTSARETTRTVSLYAVNVASGATRLIASDDFALANPVFSADGKNVAATRGGSWTRRGYRGSGNSNLILFPAKGGAGTWLAKDAENERSPVCAPDGKTVYFVSDKSGTFNIWRKVANGRAAQMTKYTEGNVFYPSLARNGGKLVYEHDFALWSLDTTSGETKKLDIFAPTDDRSNSLRRETYRTGVQEVVLSQDGKTLAFVVHGEIFTQPAAGGESTRLTETPQREEEMAVSPDGKTLAFVSDRSGNAELYTAELKTKEAKRLTQTAGTAEGSPVFAPDGKTIAFRRGYNGAELCILPTTGGEPKVLVRDPSVQAISWSPDGKWIAYTRMKSHSAGALADIFVVNVAEGKPVNITRYPGINGQPVWSKDGKKLFFLSNRSGNMNVWSVSLEEEKEKDEEKDKEEKKPEPKPETKPVEVKIDFKELHERAKAVTRTEGGVSDFALSPDGKTVVFAMAQLGRTDLWRISAEGSDTPTRLTQSGESGSGLKFAADGSKVFYLSGGGIRTLAMNANAAASIPVAARMDVDTRDELMQIFDEAWRKMRDGYYDEKMHGADWNAVRARYRPVVEDITYKEDFYVLFALALGELNSSHIGLSGATGGPEGLTTASLGVEWDDTYTGKGVRVKSVMPKGPADKDEGRLAPGDVVVKVDGKPVTGNESLYTLLGDKASKKVELLVSKDGSEAGARTVKVRATTQAAYKQLDYDRWQKEREAITEKLSGGRLGYLHLNAMSAPNLEKFRRAVFGDMQAKDGLVLDVRFNGGGSIADEMFAILQDKVFAYRTLRGDTERSTAPISAFNKPLIVLANEASFSNAEVFPWGVKELKLGKVVGMPTFGGVIGTGGTNLIDGSTLRMPQVGTFTLSGINQENNGCPPDILVENTPEDIFTQKDRQLERAVEELVKSLPQRSAEKK